MLSLMETKVAKIKIADSPDKLKNAKLLAKINVSRVLTTIPELLNALGIASIPVPILPFIT